jgi:hypothetical protein
MLMMLSESAAVKEVVLMAIRSKGQLTVAGNMQG